MCVALVINCACSTHLLLLHVLMYLLYLGGHIGAARLIMMMMGRVFSVSEYVWWAVVAMALSESIQVSRPLPHQGLLYSSVCCWIDAAYNSFCADSIQSQVEPPFNLITRLLSHATFTVSPSTSTSAIQFGFCKAPLLSAFLLSQSVPSGS